MNRLRSMLFVLLAGGLALPGASTPACAQKPETVVKLPKARLTGAMPVEAALATRRSNRALAETPLGIEQVAQIAWAAQGITGPNGHRTAPSAMARYPLELYLVAGAVEGFAPGVYRYVPEEHALAQVSPENRKAAMTAAANNQASVAKAPLVIAFATKAGARVPATGQVDPWTAIEVGAAVQNVYLQTTALGLGTVAVGSFREPETAKLLELQPGQRIVLVMPIGKPQ